MPSSYSTRLRFELIGVGEFGVSGNWGTTTNTNLGTLIEESIAGIASVPVTDGAATVLTAIDGGTDQARQMIINLTGTLSAQREVRCPAVQKLYFVRNATTGGFGVLFKTASGTGVVVPNGRVRAVYCDATNVNDLITDLPAGAQLNGADIVTTTGTQTLTNKTLTSPRVGTAILDTNGNESIRIAATASAVNDIQVTNAATSGTPTISAVGNDTNIGLNLVGKGTGQIFANSLPVVTTTGTQTLSSKTIDNTCTISARDDIFQLQDNGDSNKRARFELSGVGSGATRVITIPNFDYTLGQVVSNSVVTGSIVDLNVTTAKIADLNITEGKLADSSVTVNKIGTNAVTAVKISDLNVTTAKIADLNVTTAKIADLNVTEGKLANSSVTANKIGTGAVTEAKIADNNVTVNKIGNGQVTEAKIADGNVTVNKIGDGQVTAVKIADGNVTESKIADGNVTVNKIGNGQVTPAKLSQPLTSAGVQSVSGVTSREWTGIPSWVRRVTISFADVTLASGSINVRLGTSGGYVTTNSYYWDSTNLSGWMGSAPRTAFTLATTNSNSDYNGHFVLTNHQDGNTWIASALFVISNVGPYQVTGAGYITLGQLDRIQVLQLGGGATTFASGSVSVLYE